eukprot:763366-Hanusia_phi.AAC.4
MTGDQSLHNGYSESWSGGMGAFNGYAGCPGRGQWQGRAGQETQREGMEDVGAKDQTQYPQPI